MERKLAPCMADRTLEQSHPPASSPEAPRPSPRRRLSLLLLRRSDNNDRQNRCGRLQFISRLLQKEMRTVNKLFLSRREFNARCIAVGVSLPAASAMLVAAPGVRAAPTSDAAAPGAARTVRFPDGSAVPAVGQGAWHLGQGRHPEAVETDAL